MDLTGLLLRAGAARPHVMVAAIPGGTAVRLAAEEQVRRRGWPAAVTPADTDILLVAGTPAADIAAAVEETWAAIAAPRARAHAARPGEVVTALDAARAGLASAAGQRGAAAAGAGGPGGPHARGGGPGAGGPGGNGGGHGSGGHRGHDGAGGHGHVSGGHHGGGMGEAGMPAGLPLAGRAEDRDGLKLDQLHLPLGPFLPDWPAGLVVRVTLQGDVIQHAEAGALGLTGSGGSFWAGPWRQAAAGEPVTAGLAARRRAAAHLDSLARLLAVAGWDAAATAARRLRDDALRGVPAMALGPAVRRFTTRVARSRVLAWSTRGMGALRPDDAAAGPGGPALRMAGDVTARYRRWCRDIADLAGALDDSSPLQSSALAPPGGGTGGGQAPSAASLAVLPRLLEGSELAAARLIVASLDPDLDELAAGVGADVGR